MRVAGIMSGTSLDGIDVAIVDLAGSSVRTVAALSIPYKPALRTAILNVSGVADISALNFRLGEEYAKAVQETCRRNKIDLASVDLIGCHGQTVYHQGRGTTRHTLQIGESSVIAERLGINVVSDFRTRDMAAGGQGAPLVPFADHMLFRSTSRSRVALNIGGIANITVLPRDAKPEDVIAFDTGPGNMVIDQLVSLATGGKQTFDLGGAIAEKHNLNRPLLDRLLKDRWFTTRPPKTAGREQYGAEFVAQLQATGLPLGNLITTATVFTSATIALAIQRFAPDTEEIIAAGGGVHNSQIMAHLAGFLPRCRLTTTAEFGVDPDAKEAIAFALLAYRTWRKLPGNLPSATGARHPVVLGKVIFGSK